MTPNPEIPKSPNPPRSLAEMAAAARGNVGLQCPNCGCHHFRVIYTRPKGTLIMRRRECRHCGRRLTTWERVVG